MKRLFAHPWLIVAPLSIISTILPIILIAIGSAYGIQIISHYYDEAALRRGMSRDEHRELVFAVMRKMGWPVFLAALTTFAGFASFCFTTVVPIREFGVFSSFGVLASFVVVVLLVPSLLLIRGPERIAGLKVAAREGYSVPRAEDRLSAAVADAFAAAAKRRALILAVAAVGALASLAGLSRLVIDNVMVEYFKSDSDVARADAFIRDRFGGSKTLSVVVSNPAPGEVLRPDVLEAMDGLSAFIRDKVPEVGKTISFTDLVKRVNQVLNADADPSGLGPSVPRAGSSLAGGGAPLPAPSVDDFGFAGVAVKAAATPRPAATPAAAGPQPVPALDAEAVAKLLESAASTVGKQGMSGSELAEGFFKAINYRGASYYEIPTDPARYGKSTAEELRGLVSNYLVLLTADISAYADDPLEPTSIRMNIQLRTAGQRDSEGAIEAIRGYVEANFPKDMTTEIGGKFFVEKSLNDRIVQSQLWSVAISILMVFLILAAFYRSAVAGLIGLVPVSLSILIDFAVMGFAGIKLNIGTAMVASISVGIGIDYTIHYLAAFRREYRASGGKEGFVRRTFLSSGKAIIFNAVSVGLGFAALAVSHFNILANLGVLVALTMGTSSLISLTVLPVLLLTLRPAFIAGTAASGKADIVDESMEVEA
jgi:predicted RND superfamily exporter protein